ncbi:MAG: hypothetical protein GC178_18395 [Flavobacteriales bacterium]|nr:hypothetical protein [Flavobacteriales bacterium]
MKLSPLLRNLLGSQGQPEAVHANGPLFITGCMRSGTTLLSNLLHTHPQLLRIGAEMNEVWTAIGGAKMLGTCDHLTAANANPTFTYQLTDYIANFVRDGQGMKRKLMRLNTYWDEGHGRMNYDWKHIVPMNKSPHLMNKLEYANALFPEAKFIIIIRDVFGYSSSTKYFFEESLKHSRTEYSFPANSEGCWNTRFEVNLAQGAIPSMTEIVEMWFRLNELALNAISALSDRILILNYEQLVNDQASTMANVFRFLNLQEAHRSEEQRIQQLNLKHRNTSTSGDSLTKWKELLSQKEISEIDAVIQRNQELYARIEQSRQNAV